MSQRSSKFGLGLSPWQIHMVEDLAIGVHCDNAIRNEPHLEIEALAKAILQFPTQVIMICHHALVDDSEDYEEAEMTDAESHEYPHDQPILKRQKAERKNSLE